MDRLKEGTIDISMDARIDYGRYVVESQSVWRVRIYSHPAQMFPKLLGIATILRSGDGRFKCDCGKSGSCDHIRAVKIKEGL